MKPLTATYVTTLVLGSALIAWADCGPITNIVKQNPSGGTAGTCKAAGQCYNYNYIPGNCPRQDHSGCTTTNSIGYSAILYDGTNCTGEGEGNCITTSNLINIIDAKQGVCDE